MKASLKKLKTPYSIKQLTPVIHTPKPKTQKHKEQTHPPSRPPPLHFPSPPIFPHSTPHQPLPQNPLPPPEQPRPLPPVPNIFLIPTINTRRRIILRLLHRIPLCLLAHLLFLHSSHQTSGIRTAADGGVVAGQTRSAGCRSSGEGLRGCLSGRCGAGRASVAAAARVAARGAGAAAAATVVVAHFEFFEDWVGDWLLFWLF